MPYFDTSFISLSEFYFSEVMLGVFFCSIFFLIIACFVQFFKKSSLVFFFEWIYEIVYNFYADILGKEISVKIKIYIVSLFFVILFANIFGIFLDFIAPIFGQKENGDFLLGNYIIAPSSDMVFNIALAFFSVLLLLFVQFRSLGVTKFFYNYFPVLGKGYLQMEGGEMSAFVHYPLSLFVKIGDIIISLFLGLLDLIGLAAKVISLSFRLFGNMTSGTILLGMLLVAMTSFSESITSFIGGINFPIIAPLIVYAQATLVALIQAMVFPLLVAIFIRMAVVEA